jgi:hypothetical protein
VISIDHRYTKTKNHFSIGCYTDRDTDWTVQRYTVNVCIPIKYAIYKFTSFELFYFIEFNRLNFIFHPQQSLLIHDIW